MKLRAKRVAHLIQHELINLLELISVRDERLLGSHVTITFVRISDDLKQARIFVQELGFDRISQERVQALNENSYWLKKELSHNLGLRHTPTLKFEEDVQLLESQRLYALIEDTMRGKSPV